MDRDREHLQILALFHWILAGIAALFSLFPVLYFLIGISLVTGELHEGKGNRFEHLMGWMFVLFAAAWILIGILYASFLAIAARSLSQRRHHMFCLVMAGVSCAFFPFGTVLGVFTILALTKEPVRAMFADGGVPHPN